MFNSLGLMSGTSMDGVDLSVIKSDGYSKIEYLYDKYYEFDDNLFSRKNKKCRENIHIIQ